jgi:hypothetical protein
MIDPELDAVFKREAPPPAAPAIGGYAAEQMALHANH